MNTQAATLPVESVESIENLDLAHLAPDNDIDALLDGLDELGAVEEVAAPVEEIIEDAPLTLDATTGAVVSDEAILGDALRELEMQEAKAEAYAEQDASSTPSDMTTELPEPEERVEVKPVEEKPKKPRISSAGVKKSELITRHLGANSAEFFALEVDDAELSADDLKAKEKEVLATVDALPKKVGEKATNLFNFLKTGEKLSCFTKIAFDLLDEKGTFTSEDLRNKLISEGYTQGTANSQAQQMMQLLPALKIGVRVKNLMSANDDSLIFAKYQEAKATPAAE